MKDQTKTPEEKQLQMMKIQTVMIAGILVLILAFVLFMAFKVNDIMAMAEQLDLDELNAAVSSLKSAADKLSAVDVDSLNSGIASLSETAGELSSLDFQKLNIFMNSLEGMSKEMDALTKVFKGFLGR